jgi:hypothetical protein
MNSNSIPIIQSCKLFDILIRPILNYNSEIWFMDDYFLGNLPSSDLAEILHAIFFKPKIYLQNSLCIFS